MYSRKITITAQCIEQARQARRSSMNQARVAKGQRDEAKMRKSLGSARFNHRFVKGGVREGTAISFS